MMELSSFLGKVASVVTESVKEAKSQKQGEARAIEKIMSSYEARGVFSHDLELEDRLYVKQSLRDFKHLLAETKAEVSEPSFKKLVQEMINELKRCQGVLDEDTDRERLFLNANEKSALGGCRESIKLKLQRLGR